MQADFSQEACWILWLRHWVNINPVTLTYDQHRQAGSHEPVLRWSK